MKKTVLPLILVLGILLPVVFTPFFIKFKAFSEPGEIQLQYISTIEATFTDEQIVPLLDPNSGIYKTASNYEKFVSQNYYQPGEDIFFPKDITVSWTSSETPLYYTFKIGMKADLSDATTYVTDDTSIVLSDLFAAKKYYYQIVARFDNKTVLSRVFQFRTAALPRTITIPGVSNTRDIGGYLTVDGKYQVKQGMFYRGGEIDDISEESKTKMLNIYGIKTDLDVRGDTSHSVSPLGSEVNYVKCLGPYYLGATGINSTDQNYKNALLKEIQTCAVKENYPIYLHCSLGRDRTGTLAFLINALLGVGEMDLYMEYELSFFSETGTRGDHNTPTFLVGERFAPMYNYIKNYGSGTLQENTEKFMLDLGVTAEEISSIREIMLEEVQP